MSARVAVLASGGGSNLQAILDHLSALGTAAPAQVVYVASSRPGAGALERARASGVEAEVVDAAGRESLHVLLRDRAIDLVALAGYLTMIPPETIRAFRGRIVNVHPSLLPAFGGPGMYGRRVHEAVLRRGVLVSGVTVHFVDEIYDNGPIVAQWPVPVLPGDDAAALAARVLEAEHRIYPRVVASLASGQVRLGDDGHVRFGDRAPMDFHFAGIARDTFLKGPAAGA